MSEDEINMKADDLVKLYLQEKEKNKKLEARKYMLNAETGEITAIPTDNNYISKNKIREKMEEVKNLSIAGYEILQELLEEK